MPIVLAAGELASLRNADSWINSPPLTATELRGKVVLIDFWTYTSVNWLRQLPTSARGRRNTKTRAWS